MNPEIKILEKIAELISADRIGALEPGDRIGIIALSGKTLSRYLDGSERVVLDVMMQGLDRDQRALMNDMNEKCDILCRNAKKIHGDDHRVFSIRIGNMPAPHSMMNDGKWYFKSTLRVDYIKLK